MPHTPNAISSKCRRAWLAVAALSLAACSTDGGGKMRLFSAEAPVVVLMVDDIFIGNAVGYMDRTGTIEMASTSRADVRCAGQFAYTGARIGRATLNCSDGMQASVTFNALSNLSGYGYGAAASGPVSFTYGLTSADAVQYLRFPPGLSADLSGPKPVVRRLAPSASAGT